MVAYELQSQHVSAALDFARCSLTGSTRLVLARHGGAAEVAPRDEDPESPRLHHLLPFSVPTVSYANYKRVDVNGGEAPFHVAKAVEPGDNVDSIINGTCRSVDLMTLDGIHAAAQQVCRSLLYIQLSDCPKEVTIEIHFEYLELNSLTDAIYFEKHWLLPRCSTSYREYSIFVSSPASDHWFPTALLTPALTVSDDCCYCFDVTVPQNYTVVCGFMLRDDDDHSARSDNLNRSAEGKTVYRFKCSSRKGLGPLWRHCFGLFAGEFDLWDGTVLRKRKAPGDAEQHVSIEDEDALESYIRSTPYKHGKKPSVTYVTLQGFGFLLEPTNVATPQCLDVYRRALDLEIPANLHLLFLPQLQAFPQPPNMATNIRTQNFIDIKRCTAYTGSESYLHGTFLQPLATCYKGMFYQSGNNIVVYSMDILHSYSDIDHDPKSIDCRLAIAHGLALPFMLKRWIHPSRDMHLDLMLQSYLVDQFIKRNMGNNEYRARLWAVREVFATVTEIFGDDFPLCQQKGASTSAHILRDNTAFLLKCRLLPNIIDALFTASNFLPDNLFIQSVRRRILAISRAAGHHYHSGKPGNSGNKDHQTNNSTNYSGSHQTNTNNSNQSGSSNHHQNYQNQNHHHHHNNDDHFAAASDGNAFWKLLGDEIVRRYINAWNTKPPNRLVLENQLDINSRLEEILRRGVEHDHLSSIMKQYHNMVRSFIHGTGCPQINMGFALQLQRKGTSMDHLNFRVDIKSLQPPLDVTKEGRTAYSVCYAAGLSVRNLLETYKGLARVMQLDDQTEGNSDMTFTRVMQLFSLDNRTRCVTLPHALDFGDIANPVTISTSSEAGILRRNMSLLQLWHDPIDLVGRDGNFLLGYGYVGTFPYNFCLGNGPIWDCLDILKHSCDVNSMIDSFVDNGSMYCGTYNYRNGYERIFGKGSLPVASNGGIPFWKLIHQQSVMMDLPNSSTPLSGGYSKQWIAPFKADIVEDDGVRENVRMIGALVPTSYKVNPRAERGRKKVAIKGVPEKDLEDAVDDSNRRNTYVGHQSESDRMVIEWMKMLFIGIHPELSQLDNRSVVAKICSKTRLPLLWMRVDSGFRLIGRIRRCQSSSMWEQQLISDNNIHSQLEAAAALGSFGRSINFHTTESPIVRIAISKLDQMMRRHRVHPAVRSRCLFSLVCLHNRDPREHEAIQDAIMNYLSSFSLNNTGTNFWHPSEGRFMLDFFKAVALLRNEYGYSPQIAVDIFARILEGMNGVNYMVHATNIVECCSYLAIPPCALKHSEDGGTTTSTTSCLELKRLWQLLWHLFRLDGIPGSGSCNRLLAAAFLRCLSRQPLLLELCFAKFLNEKDLGFEFDFVHFIPLSQNVVCLGQVAFELGQTYHSKYVHFAAIQALLRVVMTGEFTVTDEVEMQGETEVQRMKMVKLSFEDQMERIQRFEGIYEATRCAVKLYERITESHLKLSVWEAYALLVEELAQSHPVLFMGVDTNNEMTRNTRDLLYNQLRPHSISSHPFNIEMFIRLRTAISLMFGHGFMWDDDANDSNVPNTALVTQRIERLTSGHSMPRIAAFRRVHGEGGRSGNKDWIEVAVEAVSALKELPQARWFINDPERSVVGYRSLVRHPMWLVKIEQKALSGQYTIPMQFKADMALVFKNAKSVNKADSMPFADAVVLEEQFETLWPAIVRTFQRSAKVAISQ